MGNVPPKKVVNADTGTADLVGGNDWDDLVDFLNDVDKTGPVLINTTTRFRTSKLLFRDSNNDHNYTNVFPNLTGNRIINWPLLTGDDTVTFNDHAATIKNKTLDSTNSVDIAAIANDAVTYAKIQNVSTVSKLLGRGSAAGAGDVEEITLGTNLTMSGTTLNASTGGGGDVTTTGTQTLTNKTIDYKDNPLILRENTYLIFKDGSTYYARNGTTGALTSNTDFKTLIQAITDAISSGDDTTRWKIKLGPGDFDLETTWTIGRKFNICIEGSGMGVTRLRAGASVTEGTSMWTINGSVGSSLPLTSNAAAKQKTIVMSSGNAATLAVGDWVLVRSNAEWDESAGGASSTKIGEMHQVSSIASGTVTFKEQLWDTYNTADSASAIKISPVEHFTLRDLTISKHASYPGTNSIWFYIRFGNRCLIENVEMIDYPGQFESGIDLRSCTNSRVNNCHIQQNIAYNFQYGISISGCSQNIVVSNCTATGPMRHHFEAANGETGTNGEGVCRNIQFVNCTVTGGEQNPFDTHADGEFISFNNCGILGGSLVGGFKSRSPRTSFIGCYVIGSDATGGSGSQSCIHIDDFANDNIISNCIISNCTGQGITLGQASTLFGTIITGCVIDGCSANGIDIRTGVNNLVITNNVIKNNGTDGISCVNVDNSVFVGNRITSNGAYGIDFEAATCQNNLIVANWFGSNVSGQVRNGAQTGNIEASNKGY